MAYRTASEIGLDFSALVHEITDHFKNHVINRHGDPGKHGAATVTISNFDMIPIIIKKPDMAIIGAKRWGFFDKTDLEGGKNFDSVVKCPNSRRPSRR